MTDQHDGKPEGSTGEPADTQVDDVVGGVAEAVDGGAPTFAAETGDRDEGQSGDDLDRLHGIAEPLRRLGVFTDRYERDQNIGMGGMGIVDLCEDLQIGRRVAVKTLRPKAAGNALSRNRFVREARIQAQLEHPSIVPVYDMGLEPDGTPFFTMKRVRGTTLEQVLADVNADTGDSRTVFSQRKLLTALANVCLAIDFAHRRGVVHRDLKPANIMLGDFGEVYVLDWGIAKLAQDADADVTFQVTLPDSDTAATRDDAVLGTVGYMAPEQLHGRGGKIDARADVYALGSILFEIVSGEPLHKRDTPYSAWASTLEERDVRPSVRVPDGDIAPELDDICVRAAALDREDRLSSARELADEIERYLDGQRDEERRRELADSHARAAAAAAQRAMQGGAAEAEDRREALREVARCLGLSPNHRRALTTLVELLQTPPSRVPSAVTQKLDALAAARLKWACLRGGLVYASWLLAIPLFLWAGVRDWLPIAAMLGCLAVGSVIFLLSYRWPGQIQRTVFVVVSITNAGLAFLAAYMGVFIVLPMVVVVNTTAVALYAQKNVRVFAVAFSVLAVFCPLALELTGLLSPSYVFVEGGLLIIEKAVAFSAMPTLAFLSVATVLTLVIGPFLTTAIADTLRSTEHELQLQNWTLQNLVPALEPTLEERER